MKIIYSLSFALFLVLIFSGCGRKLHDNREGDLKWIGTWNTSQQLVEARNMPPQPGLTGNTIRQVVCISIGGEQCRVSFSNEFSTSPLEIQAAHIAVSAGGSAIIPETDNILTFNGKEQVILKPGDRIISDPVDLSFEPRSNVSITLYLGKTSADVTGHPGSRTTSYIMPGNTVSIVEMPGAIHTDHWYIIDGIEVNTSDSAAALVVLGNSITDGRGSGTNKQNRWPDELSKRLLADPATRHIAVLNQGIGGNCVLRDCLGPAAVSRFERDVLRHKDVRWLIILEGINDIGQSRDSMEISKNLVTSFEQMIDQAHTQGIKVFGATLLPFAGSFYDSPHHQQAWQTVNDWIRNSGRFDAVIDLARALEDPDNPSHMLPKADTGDHLHPNETGHRMMADAVNLKLFK